MPRRSPGCLPAVLLSGQSALPVSTLVDTAPWGTRLHTPAARDESSTDLCVGLQRVHRQSAAQRTWQERDDTNCIGNVVVHNAADIMQCIQVCDVCRAGQSRWPPAGSGCRAMCRFDSSTSHLVSMSYRPRVLASLHASVSCSVVRRSHLRTTTDQ